MKLQDQRAAALKAAQDIVDHAKDAGRDLTVAEADACDAKFAQIEELDAAIEGVKETQRIFGQMSAPHSTDFDDDGFGEGRSETARQLAKSLSQKQPFGFDLPLTTSGAGLGVKAAFTNPDTVADSQIASDQPLGTATVSLRDLLDQAKTDRPFVRWYSIGQGEADVVAEGDLKPDLGSDVTPTDGELVKLAATFQASDEMREDAGWLLSHIGREALRAVLAAENRLITSTFDATTNALTANGSKSDALDVLAEAIGAAESLNGVTPTKITMHPADLAQIRVAKASTGGGYFIDPVSAGPTFVHGVSVQSTPAAAPGTAYLSSPGLGVFFKRADSVRVETGFVDDDWQRNLFTTRVEERVLPAIVRPSLLSIITLTE